jgi:hypothetical protein
MASKKDTGGKTMKPFQFGLTGKLFSSVDSTRLEQGTGQEIVRDNFATLKNMRYHDNGIRGIRGMSKINSTAITTYIKPRVIHQFDKTQPEESHVLVQAFNTGLTASQVLQNTATVPATSDFSGTALHTDASDANGGRFANVLLGRVMYCNGSETLVWGGDEVRVTKFIVYDPNGTFLYDYTDKVQNTLSDTSNVATLKQVSGIGSETMILFHFEDEASPFGSDDPGATHTATGQNGMDRSSADTYFDTYSALFDGSDDYMTIPDHTDFDLSSGTWTYECWINLDDLGSDGCIYAHADEGWTQDYMWIYVDTNGAVNLDIHEGTTAATGTVTLDSGGSGSVDTVTVNSVEVTDTVAATGTVTLDSGASGSVDGITVNSIEVMSGAENFDTDLSTTATNVAANITANTSSPDYNAAAVGAVVTITAVTEGTGTNGYAVVSSVTTIATTDVNMANGRNAGVDYDTSLTVTATNLAASITAATSSPNYTATSDGAVVTITSVRMGADVNAYAVASTATTIATTDVAMASGASTDVVELVTPNSVVSAATWTHIRVVESANDYYIFVNGIQKAHTSDSDRTSGAQTYDSVVHIGAAYDGTSLSKYFDGYIDEIRLTNSALTTTDFEVPAAAYTSATANVNMRVGNILPLEGFTFTVSNANTSSGTMSVYYWSSTNQWTAVTTLVDNTASGGIPLAQTGTVTFDSTEDVARQKIIDGVLGYWYKIEVTDADTATAISTVTITEPFQDMKDFWDGALRFASSVQLFEDSINKDNTVNVFEDDYTYDTTTEGDLSSYMIMDSLTTSTEYLTVGFSNRMQGLQCKLIPSHTNTTANTVIEVEYWNGLAWTSVGTIDDGTIENSISFTKSGFITWNPIAENTEFKSEVNKEEPLYYYRLSWSQSFTADVLCYFIAGIPVQEQIGKYSFPMNAQGRTWLFSDQSDRKNTAIVSSIGTVNAFNGSDSRPFSFGDESEVTAGTEVFTKLTTGAISDILVAKKNSMFLITGSSPKDWVVTQISRDIGCVAPHTLIASPIGLEFSPLQTKQVVVWQSESAIVVYDSSAIFPISDSISDYFDQSNSYAINLDKIGDSYSFWDQSSGSHEYHWLFASGSSTTLDKELVFDFRRQKWYEIARGSANQLQCGTQVTDSNGAHYTYGTIDTGFMERLENGTAMTGDGGTIDYQFELGDLLLGDDLNTETLMTHLKLVMKTKSTTSSSVTVTHYSDGNQTGKTVTLSPAKTGYDFTTPIKRLAGSSWGSGVFHRLKFTISTDDETIGFEPLWVGGYYEDVRMRLKD